VIFGACVAILFLTAVILQRTTRNPLPLRGDRPRHRGGLGRISTRVLELPRQAHDRAPWR
jgi:hypothetical protein